MSKLMLQTDGEFLAAARAIAIAEVPLCEELCHWLLDNYELGPEAQRDLMFEGAVMMVGLMAENEDIPLREFGDDQALIGNSKQRPELVAEALVGDREQKK